MTKSEPKQMSMILNLFGSVEELSSSVFAKYIDVFSKLKTNGAQHQTFDSMFAAHSEEAKDLLRKMMQIDPSKRITVDQALAHPYFSAYEDEIEDLENCNRTFDTDFEEMQNNELLLKSEVLKEIFSFAQNLTEEQFSRQNQEYKLLRKSKKVHYRLK